jgi:hypothetical protein
MARLLGPLTFSGKIDGLVYYKTRNGCYVRTAPRTNKASFMKHPRYRLTRENMEEFGHGARVNRILRNVLQPALPNAPIRGLQARLTKRIMKVIQSDTKHLRGSRKFNSGNAALLKDFEFYEDSKMSLIFQSSYIAEINRNKEKATVRIEPFVPAVSVKARRSATHFKIYSAFANINFETEEYDVDVQDSGPVPINNTKTKEITLKNVVDRVVGNTVLLALGIVFFEETNGTKLPLLGNAQKLIYSGNL